MKMLIGALIKGKKAIDHAEKTAKKKVRRTKKILTVLAIVLAFLTGAGLVAYLTYAHRNVIAAMVDGRPLPASPHKHCK